MTADHDASEERKPSRLIGDEEEAEAWISALSGHAPDPEAHERSEAPHRYGHWENAAGQIARGHGQGDPPQVGGYHWVETNGGGATAQTSGNGPDPPSSGKWHGVYQETAAKLEKALDGLFAQKASEQHEAKLLEQEKANALRIEQLKKDREDFQRLKAEHELVDVPAPPVMGDSKATVKMGRSNPAKMQERVNQIFGKHVELQHLASLVGAPDNATVTVLRHGKRGLKLFIDHPDYEDTSERTVGVDRKGNLFMHMDLFTLKKEAQGSGLGTAVLAKTIENAQKMGVKYLHTHAAGYGNAIATQVHEKTWDHDPATGNTWTRGPSSMNGFYTWPKIGYDQRFDDPATYFQMHGGRAKLKELFPYAQSVADLMLTKSGRDWWRENGSDLTNMKFDLTRNSRSLRTFHLYLAERQEGGRGVRKDHARAEEDDRRWYEEIDLNEEEEEALERAWEKLGQEAAPPPAPSRPSPG
jgi:GNAT superfamily N-acetyltransferase